MKNARFEYWKSKKDKQWYFHLLASNGEPVCPSEGYKNKADMLDTIVMIKCEAADAPVIKRKV